MDDLLGWWATLWRVEEMRMRENGSSARGARFVIGALSAAVFATSAARATDVVSTPFQGITLHQRTETSPRPLKIDVVEINLADPGIHFSVTPSNGALPGDTTLQTTRDFLASQAPSGAALAINANYFGVVSGSYADDVDLAASNGDIYSTFSQGYFALNLTQNNSAAIVQHKSGDFTGKLTDPPVSVYNAVSGNEHIITNGVNTAVQTSLEPRTAAGIATGDRLVLMTVDGRDPGVSEGVTTIELANLLLGYGVTDAINLDGGGSTTMAIADPTPRLLNVPSEGGERPVGVNLAVFASPIPEPSTGFSIVLLCTAGGMMRRVKCHRV
jgi:hypothetical protein